MKILKGGKDSHAPPQEHVSIPLSVEHGRLLDRVIINTSTGGAPLTRSQALLQVLDMVLDANRATPPRGR